ncbi:hypothetical protein ACFQS6_02055 [Xanthomonas populi]|nr:hypothetical protein [Xanthomonas populi]
MRILVKFDVLTLITHGDDDQIFPVQASAAMIRGLRLPAYHGALH